MRSPSRKSLSVLEPQLISPLVLVGVFLLGVSMPRPRMLVAESVDGC